MRTLGLFLVLTLIVSTGYAQWVRTNGPSGRYVTDFAVSPNGAGGTDVFAGTDDGVFLSTNNGGDWIAANDGLTDPQIGALIASANGGGGTNLFAGTPAGVFLSTDNGTSWTAASAGLAYVSALLVVPNGACGTDLFAGCQGTPGGISVSTNNGTNWAAVNNGLTNNQIFTIVAFPDGSGGMNLLAGTNDGGIFRSTNHGTSWAAVNTGLTNLNILSLAVKGSNLFAGSCYGHGVFLSTNSGTSWTAVNTGLTAGDVQSLVACGSNLFASVYGNGVFVSTNDGTNWTAVSTGLTTTQIFALAVSGADLLLGTDWTGVWRRPLSEMAVVEPGLVAYFPFNGNANDESGNWHDGIVHGAALTTDRAGIANAAYQFDGVDDYIQVPHDTAFNLTGDMTLCAWFKSSGPSNDYHTIIGKRDEVIGPDAAFPWLASISYRLGPLNNEFQKAMFGIRNSIPVAHFHFSNDSVKLNTWQYLVVVVRDDTSHIYLDGVLNNSLKITLARQGNDYPVNIGWNRRSGYEQFQGSIDDIRIYNYALADSRIQQLFQEGGYFTKQYPVAASWNIVSIPLTATDTRKIVLFPTATSLCYTFTPGGYAVRDTLKVGAGYWLRFPLAQNVAMTGTIRMRDTIALNAGWNMIGTISDSVPVTTIQQIPPTIIASQFFGYHPGYSPDTVLLPSRGYWIKAASPGRLVLSSAASLGKEGSSPSNALEKAGTITVSDVLKSTQTLGVTSEQLEQKDLDYFELPPAPPTGIFDVRFSTNRMLEAVKEGESKTIPIRISSAQYPLTVGWDMKDQSMTASLVVGSREVTMHGTGSVPVADANASLALRISGGASLPKEFALLQNYPNPFNPSTTIKYDLPKDSRVSLKVFNILGQEVATLVNEDQKAGYKSVQWNASSLASGVYFYRLSTSDFVQTRKLSLLR